MKNILVTYDSISNSTREAAEIITDVLANETDHKVHLKHFNVVNNINEFDVVVIGSPMRFKKFHKNIDRFIKKNRSNLENKTVCCFMTCLYLIKDTENPGYDFSVYADPSFDAEPKPLKQMNMMDKTHSDTQYIDAVLATGIRPASVAYFKGRLNLQSLGFFSRLFMKVVLMLTDKEQVGDFLKPDSVEGWAKEMSQLL